MMKFDGEKEFNQSKNEVWNKLRDARFLVTSIPDAETVGEPTETEAQCKVRPGFSFVRGTLTITINIVEAVESDSVRMAIFSKGVGNSSDVDVQLSLAEHNGGTKLHWTAEITKLAGLLKAAPKGLIRGAAQKTIDDLWTGVESRLNQS